MLGYARAMQNCIGFVKVWVQACLHLVYTLLCYSWMGLYWID